MQSLATMVVAYGYNASDCQSARDFLIDKPPYKSGVVTGEVRLLNMMGMELAGKLAPQKDMFPIMHYINDAAIPKAITADVDFFFLPSSTEKVIYRDRANQRGGAEF